MKKHLRLFVALLLMLFVNSAIAATAEEKSIDCKSHKGFVESASYKIVAIIENNGSSAEKKEADLTKLFDNIVDSNWMGKFVLGRNWNSLDDSQQQEYTKIYKQYLINSYVPNFKEYDGQKVTLIGSKPLRKQNEHLVYTKLEKNGEPPLEITYRVRKSGVCYQVQDIIAEGVSLINTQRQDFGSVFKSGGYKNLISLLKSKSK